MVNNIYLLSSGMKKLFAIFASLILGILLIAPASYANYYNYPPSNSQFHPRDPDYYDGNQRLKLKERADIERASASNLHYDQYSRDYYRCNWKYNKNLGTWVCEKDYGRSQACPFGYTRHSIQNHCIPIRPPANAHLNSRGNGWVCDTGYHLNYPRTGCDRDRVQYVYQPEPVQVVTTQYVYVYEDEEPARPTHLPQTGAGVGLILLGSIFVGHRILRRKK